MRHMHIIIILYYYYFFMVKYSLNVYFNNILFCFLKVHFFDVKEHNKTNVRNQNKYTYINHNT